MKLTVKEQKQLIPDESVQEAFYNRDDIKNLPINQKQALWEKHNIKLDSFREFLSKLDSYVI